ncbi:ADP-ribose pyrophosphatase, mitochondrial isoform X3 [Gopherus evgoodei]|uniref:ADP-ribose pyrophosphatase, mitochondrial isoform X3 n=1 Tax=Gopherus evgoodei TaxID=1825980 RepID=UPI0011CF8986|nr:ADP-ribose pyrophosphatase, mitochondrial isoform X3 [Gopherus evgoodei]
MARWCLARTVTVVSLTATLSAVAVSSSVPVHWFNFYPVSMLSCYNPNENVHNKAHTSPYPGSKVERSKVPTDKVSWRVEWEDYKPVEYTAASVLAGPTWADPQISAKNFSPKFNEKDGQVERRSLSGLYEIKNGRPRVCAGGSVGPGACLQLVTTSQCVREPKLVGQRAQWYPSSRWHPGGGTPHKCHLRRNPSGRTGLVGRGLLGRWGPNHAADPIITRWKRDSSGNKIAHPISGKNILQFVAIKRKDCGEWAIPGGMVDPGEKISATLKREFMEEALNSLQKSRAEKEEIEKQMNRLFNQEHFVVYKGYVDDPRNTDNAWIETEAVNYHDEPGETMDNLLLEAGDDAGKVKWVDISEKLKLYANHGDFIKLVAEKWGAHWNEDPVPGCHK